jgi:hypothetical protein
MKINEADTQIVCPEQACKLHVSEDVVAALCQPATVEKYRNYVLESFVNESRTTVWCPRADCGLAVVASSSSSSKYVTCQQVRSSHNGYARLSPRSEQPVIVTHTRKDVYIYKIYSSTHHHIRTI